MVIISEVPSVRIIMKFANPSLKAIAVSLIALFCVSAGVRWMHPIHWPMAFQGLNPEVMKSWILSLGAWGPLVYIGALALSVVLSQIPGAPLAIVAGTIWSPFWAGVYTVIGGFLGAAIAYGLGRRLGAPLLKRFLGKDLALGFEEHSSRLGHMIFLSRLFPVVPFDLLSYGAGVSQIAWPTYAVATLTGMIPSTFFLTYSGNVIPWQDWNIRTIAAMVVVICVVPVVLFVLKQWKPWEKLVAIAS